MLKSVLFAAACAIASIGGQWLAVNSASFWPGESASSAKPSYEVRRVGVLNVPLIRKGELQGYIVVRLGYAVSGPTGEFDAQAVEAIMQDEAFRSIYSDSSIDPKKLESFDLNAFTKKIADSVRSRVSSDAFKDVLVNEFQFVPVSALR